MNRFFNIFFFLLLTATSHTYAETGSRWAIRAGGEGNDKIRGIAASEDGGVFVTGEVSQNADFGSSNLTTAGKLDFVVAKIDAAGNVLWASVTGGPEIDRGYGVSATGDGGCFVTGHFQSKSIHFGKIELKNSGNYDGFVAKYDRDGNCIWAKRFGGKAYDYGHGIATDPRGNAVMSGTIANQGTIGKAELIGLEKSRSAVLAKYSPSGKLLWVNTASGPSTSGHNVATASDGSIYMCGYARGKVIWSDTVTTQSRVQDISVAKYRSDGKLCWVKTAGGQSDGLATSVAVDIQSGNICIAGMFKARAQFGEKIFNSIGKHDFFIAVLSPKGKFLNAHQGGGVETDYALGATSLANKSGFAVTGELSIQGRFAGRNLVCTGPRDAYVAVLSEKGEVNSFTLLGGKDHDLSYAIAATSDSAVVIAGAFRNETEYGKLNLKAKKGNDIFILKLKP